MQHKLKKLTVVIGLVTASVTAYAAPQPPHLTITAKGAKITAQWNPVDGANAYTLFYASHPDITSIISIPMAGKTAFTAELPVGASYAVAIKASDSSGESNYSNIEIVRVENPDFTIVKRTGQKNVFDIKGQEVMDRSIKDDGYYQTGTAQSFIRDDTKEVVTDVVTGLMWQDDSEAKTVLKPSITPVAYELGNISGDYSNTSGDTLTTYCANLTLGGFDDWRMPTRAELVGLNDYSRLDPAINPEFKNVGEDYCSSTLYAESNEVVWCNMAYPGCQAIYNKDENVNIRCVREEIEKPKSLVANLNRNNGVVTDNNTGLQWQDDYSDNGNQIKMLNWLDAIEYCESLPLEGGKWRLPNMNEITSLMDETTFYPSINSLFQNTETALPYWTSSTNGNSSGGQTEIGRIIYFGEGNQNITDKFAEIAVRCVR